MRLQELGKLARHFPKPLQFAPEEPSIVVTHMGQSLDQIAPNEREQRAAQIAGSYVNQINAIVDSLERASIVHLDLLMNGRNLLLDDTGRLALVDYDIAVIDDHPFSAEIERRYKEWHAGGRYARTRRQLIRSVERFIGMAAETA